MFDNSTHYINEGISIPILEKMTEVNRSTISRALVSNNAQRVKDIDDKITRKYSIKDCRKILSSYISSKNVVKQGKKIHAFYNFKGGTGKTTICYNVATQLAICGYKVLIIDTDQQGNVSVLCNLINNMEFPTLYDGITRQMQPDDLIVKVFDGLDLIPGNVSLVQLENYIEKNKDLNLLSSYLSSLVEKYDYIIFDCNPTISHLNRCILSFINCLDIVATTHPNCLAAMPIVIKDTLEYYKSIEKDLVDIFIIPNMYKDKNTVTAECMSIMNKNYSEWLAPDFAIRDSIDILKTSNKLLPLSLFCKKDSNALEDILDLVKEVLKRTTTGDSK